MSGVRTVTRSIGMSFVLVLALIGAAAAQTTGLTESMLQSALERGLARAAEGVRLLRLSLGVLIESRAVQWRVSLIDLATGRTVASTEIALPTDRDEAVAVLLREIVVLEARVTERRVPEDPVMAREGPEDQPPALLSNEARTEHTQRHAAEMVFRQRSLRFGPSYEIGAQHTYDYLGSQWQVFCGRVDQELGALEFYRAIGRPDLAHAYQRRRALMVGGFVAGELAFVAAAVLYVKGHLDLSSCNSLQGQSYAHCAEMHTSMLSPMLITAGSGMAAMAFSVYFYRNPHPIDENDAKSLADAYNQRLRRELGLPVAIRRPILRDVTLRLYVAEHDTGLALGGQFR